jgi:hypothetical protein
MTKVCHDQSFKCQTACKPGSVRAILARDDHSSGTRLTTRLTRPTRAAGRECPRVQLRRADAAAPIRSCSWWGLPCRLRYRRRGALLPPRFTLACPMSAPKCRGWTGGLFSVALSLGSPPPAVSRHRIPVEPGLSSIVSRRQRPSSRLANGTWPGRVATSRRSGAARQIAANERASPFVHCSTGGTGP